MPRFSNNQLEKAVAYLRRDGRKLEFVRWSFHSGVVESAAVVEELKNFQNPDGGFGKALEPDYRSGKSSVLATQEALLVLAECAVSESESALRAALEWLTDSPSAFDPANRRWPYLPAGDSDAPHAPWWDSDGLEEGFDHFRVNPMARILAHFYRYHEVISGLFDWGLIDDLTVEMLDYVGTLGDEVSPDTLRSLLILEGSPGLPEGYRGTLQTSIRRMIPKSVEFESRRWTEYGLQPLEVAGSPDSPWLELLGSAVEEHLDYLVLHQSDDGSWAPFWNWGTVHPEAWAIARREWAGVLTFRNLVALDRFGRIDR